MGVSNRSFCGFRPGDNNRIRLLPIRGQRRPRLESVWHVGFAVDGLCGGLSKNLAPPI